MNILLQNKLSSLADVECGSLPLSAHVILLVNIAICVCFMILVGARNADLELLRRAVPHLCEYCVHISGLGVSSKKAQEIRAMVMQLDWIKENSEEVELHHVWQDDLHWGWARRQIAQLQAEGKADSERCNVLHDLVKALDASRTNIGFPRPFAGHSLCIMHKQHMSRACLHMQKKSILDRVIALLPVQPGGKEKKVESAPAQKSAKVRASMIRAGEPSDIDYLSLLSGGSVSIGDTWRGRATAVGAVLTLLSVLMVGLAFTFMLRERRSGAAESSLLLLLLAEAGSHMVEQSSMRAARFLSHTFSAQRQATLLSLVVVQSSVLILFPFVVMGDPFSWNAADAGTLAGILGKCRGVVEQMIGGRSLPGAEFVPSGLADMALWLQTFNATLPHVIRLLAPSKWPSRLRTVFGGRSGAYDFGFTMESSQAYTVRTAMLAVVFSFVQPVGTGIAALGLVLSYATDRFTAERADAESKARLRLGAGLGDLTSCQYMLNLLNASVVLHALLLLPWIEALRWAPNPFLSSGSSASYILSAYLYPGLLLVVAVAFYGRRAEPLVVAVFVGFAGATTLFQIPLFFAVPDVLMMIGVIFMLLLLGSANLYHPLGWLLGKWDPINMLEDREKDFEAYYTRGTMPFDPKQVINSQVELLCKAFQD